MKDETSYYVSAYDDEDEKILWDGTKNLSPRVSAASSSHAKGNEEEEEESSPETSARTVNQHQCHLLIDYERHASEASKKRDGVRLNDVV